MMTFTVSDRHCRTETFTNTNGVSVSANFNVGEIAVFDPAYPYWEPAYRSECPNTLRAVFRKVCDDVRSGIDPTLRVYRWAGNCVESIDPCGG